MGLLVRTAGKLRASTLEQTGEAGALTTNVCAGSRLPGSEELLNISLQNGKHMFDSAGGRAYHGWQWDSPCTAAPGSRSVPPGPSPLAGALPYSPWTPRI